MAVAHYKAEPMYEFIRPGIHAQFSQAGELVTNDPKVIAALDAVCARSPSIKRIETVDTESMTQPRTRRK